MSFLISPPEPLANSDTLTKSLFVSGFSFQGLIGFARLMGLVSERKRFDHCLVEVLLVLPKLGERQAVLRQAVLRLVKLEYLRHLPLILGL